MKLRGISITTLFVVIVCTLLLVGNAVLGIVLMSQSGSALKTSIQKHMLSVANTAAATIDGDILETFTENDVGTDEYNSISSQLLLIKNTQNDDDIKFIYIVKKHGDSFVFTIDPDPVNPADFGEEIVNTPSQEIAWGGTPKIDDEPVADEWGSYYSVWSPIYNSNNEVVGLVGIDFAADWYNNQVQKHTASVITISVLSLFIGGIIVLLLIWQIKQKFSALRKEMVVLSEDLDKLSSEITARPGYVEKVEETKTDETQNSEDIVANLSKKVHLMQLKLEDYVKYVQEQTYTDSMTSLENKTAYFDRLKSLRQAVIDRKADFAVVIFDINGLKEINDNNGHECGDQIIIDSAKVIKRIFKDNHVYRIGGDEFIAIVDNIDDEKLNALFEQLENEIVHFNKYEKTYDIPISFSYGAATFNPETDSVYRDMFKRADQNMYENKEKYYKSHGLKPRVNYEK